jgi:hypothetical protein
MAMQLMTVFCGIKKNVLIAGKFNHLLADCYYKDKPKEQNKKDKAKENPCKHLRTEEVNAANSNHSYAAIKEVEEVTLGGITFDTSKCGQFFNFNNENVTNSSINDEHTLYYNWLADSATTSHITNQHNTFMTYEPIQNTPITGVRGLQAQAKGHSNVNIITSYNSTSYPICLCNVLYILGNKNNLFSLGCWIAKGGDFMGQKLILISKQGDIIVNRKLTKNNLIMFHFCYAKCEILPRAVAYPSLIKPELSWDIWHCCFGHIGYSGLKNLFDQKLVSGFNVDQSSPMPDCTACTEAKQSVILFNKKGDWKTLPGELMHVNIWGKYDVALINGCSYYLLLVDDASHYVTV